MRTRKGPKGITPPSPQHTFAGKGKKSCEELEHRTETFRQQPVENTTKRTPIAANCLEKAVKRKPQAEERKAIKKPLPRAHRLRHGRGTVPQHQQKVPVSEQPADHQRLLRNEETPRFCLNHMQSKNKAEQLTAQAKTEERIFPEPKEESTDTNAGPKTEGPSQTSPPKKKKKGRLNKEISKADRKTSKKKNKRQDLQSTPEPGGSRKSRRKEEEEVRAKAQKRSLRKGTNTPRPNRSRRKGRKEKQKKNKSDRRESAKNVTKASAT